MSDVASDDVNDAVDDDLARACEAHGIQPVWHGIDGSVNAVPRETLAVLAEAFGIRDAPPVPRSVAQGGIVEALDESDPERCFVPETLRDARVWGVTCQLGSLRSERNAGMGDFADLAALCRIVGDAGGDFVGLNPLNALFWSDPGRASPFSPSNRAALHPLYIALDWLDVALDAEDEAEMARLRALDVVDLHAVHALKDRVLRRAFAADPTADGSDAATSDPITPDPATSDPVTLAHARFEALSRHMVTQGHGAGWMGWPADMQAHDAPRARDLLDGPLADEVRYHVWLQRRADAQLARVNAEAHEAGLRVGLYLDLAVGVSPDGSATWADPDLVVPGIKIGAPPDPFSDTGQDWGLAPLSPIALAADPAPFTDTMRAVMRHAGAVRVDHAMALARLFLLPAHASALDGAYVHYPFTTLLDALAAASNDARCLVIGEDLGVVPDGFRAVMAARALHAYKVFWFERGEDRFDDPATWGRDALACVGTHDTATFAGWWSGADLEARHAIGQFDDAALERERTARERDRDAVRRAVGWNEGVDWRGESIPLLSALVHARIAASPCRLAAMQLDDVLGASVQPNMPGTTHEHPNWRVKLPVALEALAADSGFAAHAETMGHARPEGTRT